MHTPWFNSDFTDRLSRPLAESTALPNAAYVSGEFLVMEQTRVFASHWMLAGFGHQVPKSGDAATLKVAGKPLLLVRDGSELRIFHNVCAHRGARLLESGCTGAKLLRCPNHHWVYGLDGRVRNRPHFFGADKHDTYAPGEGPEGLRPVRMATWLDLVFVNLDGKAPPLEEYLAPLVTRLDGYDLCALRHAGTLDWELACNWKLVHENFIEPYHVFAVHPGLLKFGPMSERRPSDFEGLCFSNDYHFPEPQIGRGLDLPHIPGLDEKQASQAVWFHLFPSLSVQIFPDQMAVWDLEPLSPVRTRERIHVYLVGEAATSDELAKPRQQVFDTWKSLNSEDIEVLERMQRGRESPGFDGGTLSPYWDGAVRHYAKLVVSAMDRTV